MSLWGREGRGMMHIALGRENNNRTGSGGGRTEW